MKKIINGLLKMTCGAIIGAIVSYLYEKKISRQIIDSEKEQSRKYYEMFMFLNNWIRIKHNGKKVADYFERKKYNNIAIYGMSFIGETLVDELEGTSVHISYGIDKNADNIIEEFDVIVPDAEFKPVDVIVVTSISYYDEIEETLRKKTKIPIISVEDALYNA